MNMQRILLSVLTMILMVTLAGCGGGGGGGGGTAGGTSGFKMGGGIQGSPLSLASIVSTIAGSAASTDGTGTAARFSTPNDVVTDGTNLYVADTGNSTIRKVVIATGAVSTLAGTAGVTGSADGTGATARFNNPFGLAISSDKTTLYLSDSGNNTIRKIAISTGAVTTFAGTAGVLGSSNGIGASASFSSPTGIATDGTNLYVADSFNNKVRQIVIASSAVSTLAGSGDANFADGNGTAASFNFPNGITTDGTNLYLTDNGNSAIRQIVIATGVVSTLVEPVTGSFISPSGIATDGTSLYVTDNVSNVVRKVVIASQAVSPLAGDATGGSPGSIDAAGGAARFNAPGGITVDGTNLFVADIENGTIRKIDIQTGAVTTLAGTPGSADGTGPAAGFKSPHDICTDGANIYVADAGSSTIREIVIASGAVSTLAGTADVTGSINGSGASARFSFPSGITTDGTALYVADTGNNTIRRIVIATGAVTTLAGTAGVTGSADGTGTNAGFNSPGGITTDGTNLFVSDTGNNAIRKIVIASGVVSTLAGNAAGLSSPNGITTDGTNIYVADAGNNAIRKIAIATGAVATFAVTGGSFDFPTGITTDGTSLYLADSGNKAVRKVVIATGAVSTLSTGFSNPGGITTDGTNLFVADANDNVIVKIR